MNTQPEALRLATILQTSGWQPTQQEFLEAAAELRRLHEVNQALVDAADMALEWVEAQKQPRMIGSVQVIQTLRQALAQPDLPRQNQPVWVVDGKGNKELLSHKNRVSQTVPDDLIETYEKGFRDGKQSLAKEILPVAKNELGRITWLVDDWPANCMLYAEPPTWTPVEIGVDITVEGAYVVGAYLLPDAVRYVFYSKFHAAPVDAVNMTQERVDKMEKSEHEPNDTQLNQLIDALGHCHTHYSYREFLRVWIRDWTAHKLAKREWVGLTDEEIPYHSYEDRLIIRWAEAKLKEKNT